MPNPQSNYAPRCPECQIYSEKYVMFQNDWYWQCPKCKIDVDNPPTKKKDTLDKYLSKADVSSGTAISYSKITPGEIDLYTGTIVCPNFAVNSNFHTMGISGGEMQIQFDIMFKPSGMRHTVLELETFPMAYGMNPTEEDMWKSLMHHLMPGQMVLNVDDAKEMYASYYLKKTYPGVTVSFV